MAVGSITGAVQGDGQHRLIQTVFRHAGNSMGMVMLDPDFFDPFLLQGIGCAGITRMKVMGNDVRFNIHDFFQVINAGFIKFMGFHIKEIADMLA